ncbi:16S rRNA (guanine(527)-N(7))-methyltransferase RsmG [bacterium]|jgi:16S rRNA (guanine527-N7)-methyltransferase|nr:16S rRNA (guanine(527)-N(7))-methyltransferase RsmG [bacterium]
MDKLSFIQELEKQNIKLNSQQINQFEFYYYFLISENQKYNLTSLTSEEEVYEKHFYDSLSLLFKQELKGSVLDVGSGGGFPGLPLKIVKPDLDLTILDSTARKIDFVQSLSKKINLQIQTVVARAEEYDKTFDYVLARGLAPLNILLELCCNLVKKGGILIAMKGAKYQEELVKAKKAIDTLGYKLINKEEYLLPSEQSKRCNLYFIKEKDHGLKYPRNYAKIKKQSL